MIRVERYGRGAGEWDLPLNGNYTGMLDSGLIYPSIKVSTAGRYSTLP